MTSIKNRLTRLENIDPNQFTKYAEMPDEPRAPLTFPSIAQVGGALFRRAVKGLRPIPT